MNRKTRSTRGRIAWLATALLALAAGAVQAQAAAEETWRLAASQPSPWGAPLAPPWAAGRVLRIGPQAVDGPAPLACARARHRFVRTAPDGLFEGQLPRPAEDAARALGLPERLLTQRVTCAGGGGFDLHRSTDGRAWLGLDGAVLAWSRDTVATSSPEATVQALLVHHAAGPMAWSAGTVQAQRGWITDRLAAALSRWLGQAAAADEAPAYDGDPYTDAQEAPDAFELAPARRRGDRAEVPVTWHGPGDQRHRVHLLLVRVAGAWRVDEVRGRDGEPVTRWLAM